MRISRTLRSTGTVVSVVAFGAALSGSAQAAAMPSPYEAASDSPVLETSMAGTQPGPGAGAHSFELPTRASMATSRGHTQDDGEYHSIPGSGRHSDPDHNYHDDYYPNSRSNSTSNSSLAKCGSRNDDVSSRDDCSAGETYGLHHDRHHSYHSDDDSSGFGSLF